MTKTRSTAPTVVPPLAGRVAAVAVALVAALAPRPAAAQTGGDVGVTIAPAFLHYLDVAFARSGDGTRNAVTSCVHARWLSTEKSRTQPNSGPG